MNLGLLLLVLGIALLLVSRALGVFFIVLGVILLIFDYPAWRYPPRGP